MKTAWAISNLIGVLDVCSLL